MASSVLLAHKAKSPAFTNHGSLLKNGLLSAEVNNSKLQGPPTHLKETTQKPSDRGVEGHGPVSRKVWCHLSELGSFRSCKQARPTNPPNQPTNQPNEPNQPPTNPTQPTNPIPLPLLAPPRRTSQLSGCTAATKEAEAEPASPAAARESEELESQPRGDGKNLPQAPLDLRWFAPTPLPTLLG